MKRYPITIPALGTSLDEQNFQVDGELRPGERAARLVLPQLRALITHIRMLLPEKYAELESPLQFVDEVEDALDGVELALDNEELFAGNAKPDEDDAYDDLVQVLDDCDGVADFGLDDDNAGEFAMAMVDYWIYDVLRKQCFDFVSVLDGSTPAFNVIDSFEHLRSVRYTL